MSTVCVHIRRDEGTPHVIAPCMHLRHYCVLLWNLVHELELRFFRRIRGGNATPRGPVTDFKSRIDCTVRWTQLMYVKTYWRLYCTLDPSGLYQAAIFEIGWQQLQTGEVLLVKGASSNSYCYLHMCFDLNLSEFEFKLKNEFVLELE